MKNIIINESQNKLLEAVKSGFSLDELNKLSYNKKVAYCKSFLGNPVGSGSSRMVFQIDDERVLKLAKNVKGIAQNEAECSTLNDYYKNTYSLFPKIFMYDGEHTTMYSYDGDKEPSFQWIVSEYVLPAKAQDFKKVIGFTWKQIQAFILSAGRIANPSRFQTRQILSDDNLRDMLDYDEENSYILNELYDYIMNYRPPVGDFCRLANWGMTIRDGEPHMVILDDGFNEEIADKYYS